MEESRQLKIERLAGDGNIDELKKILGFDYTQLELDVALENAIAYSQIKTAEYLMQLGADISNYNYQGVYYAVHNDELDGLNFAISKGVDVNFDNGILLNTSIIKAINTKNIEIIKCLLKNGADPKYLTKESLKIATDFGTDELKKLIS
jgi:ankyrin repeat protein